MDRLAISTASAQTRLQTTTNNFMLLSNIKFIEARVYDDSEEDNQQGGKEVITEETANEETVTTQALKHGLDVIQTAFEKVEINDSDSDSEVEDEKVISVLQPKNPYHIRSLPAVIGTQAWVEDDKIGLVEEEMEEESDPSDSDSEDEEIVQKKDDSEYSDTDNERIEDCKKPAIVQKAEENDSISDFSDDDELFKPKSTPDVIQPKMTIEKVDSEDEKNSDESDNEPNNVSKDTTKGFASELSSKLGLSKSKPVKEISEDNDQDAMDTSDDETDAQPKPKKIVKLPPKKSVLFDSSDSDDDLFSPKPRANPPQNQAKIPSPKGMKKTDTGSPKKLPPLPPPAKSKPNLDAKEIEKASSPIRPVVSALADPDVESQSDDDFFSAISSKVTKSVSPNTKDDVAAKPTAGKSLFGDSSDEDDIFSDIKIGSKGKESSSDLVAASQKKSLFDNSDDSDDLFADLMAKSKKTKPVAMLKTDDNPKTNAGRKPIGGTPMFGGMTPAMVTAKSDHEDTSDETENIFSPVVKKASPPPVPSAASKPIMEIDNSAKENSHSPMIGILGENDAQTVPTDNHKKPIGGVSLFGGIDPFKKEKSDLKDEENTSDETEDKFSPVVKKALPTSVPVAASKPIKEIDNSSKEISPSPMTPAMVTAKSDDEDEDTLDETEDIFSPVVKKASPPPVPSAASKPIKEIDNSAKDISQSPMIGTFGDNEGQTVPTDNLRKPFGGVSLFGGFDPSKREKSDFQDGLPPDEDDVKEITSDAKTVPSIPPASSKPKHKEESKSTEKIDSPVLNNVLDENSHQIVNSKKPAGGISMFGGFDPKIFMKTSQDDEAGDISNVDDTVDSKEPDDPTETLITLTKSRPKMKGGRRPPTRAGRKNAVKESNALSFDVIDGPISVEKGSGELKTNLNNSAVEIEKKPSKAPIGGVSMFNGFNPAELIRPKKTTKIENLANFEDLNNTTEVEILTAPDLKDDEIKEITSAKEDISAVTDKSESTRSPSLLSHPPCQLLTRSNLSQIICLDLMILILTMTCSATWLPLQSKH
eukprot:GFUD01048782.1.p1 GENE.GFUD01048782.1~~GFUD01048782.1.p1  ORF type:complete len:1054 (+),score=354.61 GFUD01048782.1:38-3163(+)